MRILYAIDTLGAGGKERRLVELLKALTIRSDFEAQLAVMSKDIHYKEVLDLGLEINYIIRKTKKDMAVFRLFYKLINSLKPDVVHCWDSMTAVYATPACKMLHCKLVNGMVIDSPEKRNILNKHWLRARLTFPFSDVVVGNSRAGLTAYKAPEKKSIVIHNGFNFARTEDLVTKEDIRNLLDISTSYVVGMVATFWKYKDYQTYFKAASSLLEQRNDITFLAIGSDTDSPDSHRLIGEKHAGNFRLLGKRAEIESYINAMDVCVLATFTEGISNSVLEYMALGKPVVATMGGGTSEIVSDGITGCLVTPSDPYALADKIDSLLNDPDLRKRMGSAGHERVMKEFSADRMVENYIELYTKMVLN